MEPLSQFSVRRPAPRSSVRRGRAELEGPSRCKETYESLAGPQLPPHLRGCDRPIGAAQHLGGELALKAADARQVQWHQRQAWVVLEYRVQRHFNGTLPGSIPARHGRLGPGGARESVGRRQARALAPGPPALTSADNSGEELTRGVAAVGDRYGGVLRPSAADYQDQEARSVGQRLVLPAALLVVALGGCLSGKHRQYPGRTRPRDEQQQRQADPAQLARFDEELPAGAHRIAPVGFGHDALGLAALKYLTHTAEQRIVRREGGGEQRHYQQRWLARHWHPSSRSVPLIPDHATGPECEH